MIKLRPTQDPFYKSIISHIEGNDKVSICCFLPTGGGKSVIIGKLVNEYLRGRTLILTHRAEIFQQNSEWLEEVGLLASNTNTLRYDTRVVIAMVQTLDARIKAYGIDYIGQFENIVCDECHILIYHKVFSQYNYNKLIGFTGSPVVFGKKLEYDKRGEEWVEDFTLNHVFKHLICGPDSQDLIDAGYLVQDYNVILKLPDFDKLKESSSNPDGYTSKSMNEVYHNTVSLDKLYEGYEKYCIGKKTIIFNSSNKVNKFVYDFLKEKGLNVKMFDTSKNKEINPDTGKNYTRKEIIEWFRNERDAILINTNVFTTGFDVDDIEAVIINRATKSLALFIQMVGRGSRTTKKIYKEKFLVLDLGQNIEEHGTWSQPRNWIDIFSKKPGRPKNPINMLSTWECVMCGYYNIKGTIVCGDCGADKVVIVNSTDSKKYKEGEFITMDSIQPPSGNKIVKYCQDNNLTVSDGLKILNNGIIELFRFYKVSGEFYEKRKEDYIDKNNFPKIGFENRVKEIFRPGYFAILNGKNGLRGSRRRAFQTEFDRVISNIEKKLGVQND